MATPKKRTTDPGEALSPLAQNLRRLRTERGWSQGELAERIGVHLTHVSRVETGKYTPGLDFVVKAAGAFGVTVDDLVTEHPEGLEEVRLEDRELTERIRLLEDLDERDREALFTVMDAVLTKQRMKKVLESAAAHEAAG
jgi:transcriptional regulator with XRE-family HTH domain